ncbi:phosphoadenosine phosphosulfate reductase family protein [Aequorivita sp. Q41]|uniref:phosphoadenosine phosphosulfate reductase domain-containing protein n=1 Tax=Aequorivita sp. Q41 TaxID=3153300 RepID=UPI00324211C2
MDIQKLNSRLSSATPQEIISWALSVAKKPIITTNFSPYSASILHAVVTQKPTIEVVWVDTGYNTSQTYSYALRVIEQLQLNVHTYVPRQSAAFRNVQLGIPSVEDPKHTLFTEQVKLEPFRRAMNIHKPDVWFTNLRKGQTAFRDSIDVLSYSKDGVLKVSPFYNFSDAELDVYLSQHKLPNEFKYFDPTKQLANRECGLHI